MEISVNASFSVSCKIYDFQTWRPDALVRLGLARGNRSGSFLSKSDGEHVNVMTPSRLAPEPG